MKPNLLLLAFISLAIPPGLHAQLKPETQHDFDCYIQSAEARMDARKPFVLADADSALNQKLVKNQKVETIAANGANPHKLSGAQLYDWIGTVFIPGASLDRLIQLLRRFPRGPYR